MTAISIVVIGHFNPVILHPEWFRRFKLLPEEEITAAQEERVVDEESSGRKIVENPPTAVTPFRTHIAFHSYRLHVTPDRFDLGAINEGGFFELPSLAIKIFSILSHTPTSAVGFNYEAHWKLQEPEEAVLRRIFSADQDALSSISGGNYKIGGKLAFNKNECQITLVLERSAIFKDAAYINFNFHRDIPSQEASALIEVIRSNFSNDLQQAKTIAVILLGEPTDVWRLQ